MISASTRFETVFKECPLSDLSFMASETLDAIPDVRETVSLLRALMSKSFIEGVAFAGESVADGVDPEDLADSCYELHLQMQSVLDELEGE